MQQAARVSDMTAFMTAEVQTTGGRDGHLVEFGRTDKIFTQPERPPHRGLHYRTLR